MHSKQQVLSKLSHTELHHLPHDKRSRSSPSRSRSSPRTVSFPFPFLSLIHIAHFSVRSTLSSVHALSPIHSLSSFLSPINTASIHTPKIQRKQKPTHPQTHKQPNLRPTLLDPIYIYIYIFIYLFIYLIVYFI